MSIIYNDINWQVPLISSDFGDVLQTPIKDSRVLIMFRDKNGTHAIKEGAVCLPTLIYTSKIAPLTQIALEIIVVGLDTGNKCTIWAKDDENITHPYKILEDALFASYVDSTNPLKDKLSTLDLPDDGAYMIVYDDDSVESEVFTSTGAKDAAISRYNQISNNWNASLFVKIDYNSKDFS